MSLLEISQIIFNFIVSSAILVVAVFAVLIAYDTLKIVKSTRKFVEGVSKESVEIYNKINTFFEGIFKLSSLAKLLKKKKK